MAKVFGYQAQVGGPMAYTNVSDADCDAQYASAVANGALTNGLPVVFCIEWPAATLNATKTLVTASTGTPLFYANPNPPASYPPRPHFMLPITLANGANSDIDFGNADILLVNGPSGGFSISGFKAGVDGQQLIVRNGVAQALTITHDATSATGNKIYTATGADIVNAGTKGSAIFVYSKIDAHWLCIYPVASA